MNLIDSTYIIIGVIVLILILILIFTNDDKPKYT